jgi:cytochrome c
VLVFSKTAEYRHPSISDGVAAVERLGRENEFAVEATENAARFTEEDLWRYGAVVFLNTTGDVLDAEQQDAFERYVRTGGGYAGVHAAADTEYDRDWYGGLVGPTSRVVPGARRRR